MNATMAIGIVVVLIILVVGGAYVLTRSNGSTAPLTTVSSSVLATSTIGASTNVTIAPGTVMMNESAYAVQIGSSATMGSYLENRSGYTLYTYSGDVRNSSTSSCAGECASAWPPFYVTNLTIAPGLNAADFAIINRTGGAVSKQITYKGWPLYFFDGDHAAGQINGNGIGNFQIARK